MLILEDQPTTPVGFEWQFADNTGKGAVDASVAVRGTKEAEAVQSGAQGEGMTIVSGKIFIKRGGSWVDAEHKNETPTVVLQYATDEYFALLAKYPELGKYFALGLNVIVYYNNTLYQVQEESVTSSVDEINKQNNPWGKIKDNQDKAESYSNTLGQNYPNPFNPQTWMPFTLAEDSDVVIKIYDVNGNLVRKLELGRNTAGKYTTRDNSAFWDGKNDSEESVSTGIYFYVLETDNFTSVKKMMLKK